jgi:GNAT superfamily N-acetyltransferase
MRLVTLEERPELKERAWPLFEANWPPFILGDPVAARCWDPIVAQFASYHVALIDEATDELVGLGFSVPVAWDRTVAGLPAGWQAVVEQALNDHAHGRPPTATSALSITVVSHRQGQGLSRMVLDALRAAAAAHGLSAMIAPVRPNRKHCYPLIPMDRYARWADADGAPFDPWLRVHWRLGARLYAVCPESMVITAPVADWERWTGLAMPDSGDYVVSGGLVPVTIDRNGGVGRYAEPNVWVYHDLAGSRRPATPLASWGDVG